MKPLFPALLSAAPAIARSPAAACHKQARPAATFTNPIGVGADPWIVRHNGYYYRTLTDTDGGVAIWRSDSPVASGERKIVWRAPDTGPHSTQIWAPELHFLDGRWYIYATAANENNDKHRMIVLESATDDPLSDYTFKSELYTGNDIVTQKTNDWAIDGTVFTRDGKLYFIWSGRQDRHSGSLWLYIAPMSNPWTISGNRVRLCANDDYQWERVGDSMEKSGINEAPEILQHNGRTFLVYSASSSWQTTHKMGLLELIGDDPLAPGAWRKYPRPVFSPTAVTFGIGHASFVKSPDGKEDWMLYHVKQERRDGWSRIIFAQPFHWTKDGFPDFGNPAVFGESLPMPSGSPAH